MSDETDIVFNPATIGADGLSEHNLDDGSDGATVDDFYVTDPTTGLQVLYSELGTTDSAGGGAGVELTQVTVADSLSTSKPPDWRVRLSLALGANYLYMAAVPGILAPLKETNGIIFPYMPSIQVQYSAKYDSTAITHSNYTINQYSHSSVDSITVACDFTAQDTSEANYMLAVIHFFRTVTKMFYGNDEAPARGTPPPLCYLTGLGEFQFDRHPLVISSFNYVLPTDVDYIPSIITGTGSTTSTTLPVNGNPSAAVFSSGTYTTYVPTKIQLQFSALPMVARNDISKNFSVQQYATGALLRGSQNKLKGGIW